MFTFERYQLFNNPLDHWVKFIWHFKGNHLDVHHKLLPMDSIDIIINLADDIVYETSTAKIIAPKIHVNGLRNRYSFVHQMGNIDVWGISFYAHGLYPFVNKALNHSNNEIIDLKMLSITLTDKLQAAMAPENLCKISSIMGSLESELKITDRCLKRSEIISEFLKSEKLSIAEFCIEHGINQRTFERFVSNMTGFSPINLRRLKRYTAASNQLLVNKSAKISDIVYDFNYTDQAYFTKECKILSGATPSVFREEKNTVLENAIYI